MLDGVQGKAALPLQKAILKQDLAPTGEAAVGLAQDALKLGQAKAKLAQPEGPWGENWVALGPDEGLLKGGAQGERVKSLQGLLVARGHLDKADGKLGPKTTEAIKAFQRAHGLKADGIAGPNTLRAAAILLAASLGLEAGRTQDKAKHAEAHDGLIKAREALSQIPEAQRGDLGAAIAAGEAHLNPWVDPPSFDEGQEEQLDRFNDAVTWI